MTEEELKLWMSKVNTQILKLILLHGTTRKPAWYTRWMTEEVQRRREQGTRERVNGKL